jgi:hypothetical protein
LQGDYFIKTLYIILLNIYYKKNKALSFGWLLTSFLVLSYGGLFATTTVTVNTDTGDTITEGTLS